MEWTIDFKEFLSRLQMKDIADLEKELRLPQMEKVQRIVPLRNLKRVDSLLPMREKLLFYIIGQIETLDKRKVFANARIWAMVKIDPKNLVLGQKFVYREIYQGLLEHVPKIFAEFCVNEGISNFGAYLVFGWDETDSYCLALYLPPIVEEHGPHSVIMDGVHRSFIAMQTGSAINAILVENVSLPFPCSFRTWNDVKVINLSEKPKDIEARYFGLRKGLFRDLKYLGIDG